MPPTNPDHARIRENQRRSRARRKEYLQEVETKVRQCEIQGVEASSEIQLAARRVADENRKLRSLLVNRGTTHEEIEQYLRMDSSSHTTGIAPVKGNAVQELEQVLQTRECLTNGTCSPMTPSEHRFAVNMVAGGHKEINRCGTRNESGFRRASTHAAILGLPSENTTLHYQQFHTNNLPKSVELSDVPDIETFSPQMVNSHQFQNFSPGATFEHVQPMPHSATLSQDINCTFATDMITTMAGGDPTTVRAELGCGQGTDCEVDQKLVFSVMDSYTTYTPSLV